MQDQHTLQFFLNHVEFGLPVQAALDVACFHVDHMPNSFHPRGARPAGLVIETRIDPEVVEEYCKEGIRRYDDGILDFYDTADALQGFIEVTDRRGERHAFPIASISMGVATNTHRTIISEWEASAIASEMKEYAKSQPGSVYQIDRRA